MTEDSGSSGFEWVLYAVVFGAKGLFIDDKNGEGDVFCILHVKNSTEQLSVCNNCNSYVFLCQTRKFSHLVSFFFSNCN
jgi:hypothetical protein